MKNIKFDFDDILIVPSINTNITSRYKSIELSMDLPLITAPMDTVVDLDNLFDFLMNGVLVTLPRTIHYKEYYKKTKDYNYLLKNVFPSVGFDELNNLLFDDIEILKKLNNILIDVANGHMTKIIRYCKELKEINPTLKIMVGNIANPETYRWYAKENCVDYIRVGIGNGNGCLTTKQTGIGYPKASLIKEIKEIKNTYENGSIKEQKDPNFIQRKGPYIVADGGMKDYSDIIKALALGADYVMLGSLFNKTLESAGKNYFYGVKVNKKIAKYLYNKGFTIKKLYRGMSTKQAQKAMGKTTLKTSEGVVRYRNVEFKLDKWIDNFKHYLRTAMSYTNSKNLKDFIGNCYIINITNNSFKRFNK